jgi:hypothetical protein
MFLYVLLIGPVNYLGLRLLKRGELAWLTVPVIIILCTCTMYITGFRLRGNQSVLSEISIIQVATTDSLARTTSFVGVYSPSRTSYTIQFDKEVLVEALPDSIGLTNQLRIVSEGTTIIKDLRGDIGGMPGVMVQGSVPAPKFSGQLTFNQETHGVEGKVTNGNDFSLANANLVIWKSDWYLASKDPDNPYQYQDGELYTIDLEKFSPGERLVNDRTTDQSGYQTFYPSAYESDNRELVVRDIILRGLFQNNQIEPPYYGGTYGGTSSKSHETQLSAYLVGWLDDRPVEAKLTSHRSNQAGASLVIVELPLVVD